MRGGGVHSAMSLGEGLDRAEPEGLLARRAHGGVRVPEEAEAPLGPFDVELGRENRHLRGGAKRRDSKTPRVEGSPATTAHARARGTRGGGTADDI